MKAENPSADADADADSDAGDRSYTAKIRWRRPAAAAQIIAGVAEPDISGAILLIEQGRYSSSSQISPLCGRLIGSFSKALEADERQSLWVLASDLADSKVSQQEEERRLYYLADYLIRQVLPKVLYSRGYEATAEELLQLKPLHHCIAEPSYRPPAQALSLLSFIRGITFRNTAGSGNNFAYSASLYAESLLRCASKYSESIGQDAVREKIELYKAGTHAGIFLRTAIVNAGDQDRESRRQAIAESVDFFSQLFAPAGLAAEVESDT